MEFLNGDSYHGETLNGKPHGYGIYRWANGDLYEGNFSNGLRHGIGTWKSVNGNTYGGSYHNDRRSGYGKYVWPSRSYYEGNFFNDFRQGLGKMVWPDGLIYEGNWNLGKRQGKGILFRDGNIIEEGIYDNDVLIKPSVERLRTISTVGNKSASNQFRDQKQQTIFRSSQEPRRKLRNVRKLSVDLKYQKYANPWKPSGGSLRNQFR